MVSSLHYTFPLTCILLYVSAKISFQELPTYPYCYLGQVGGPGSMSFDDCDFSPGSFACNNSDTCDLDKCYVDGGPQHRNCSCTECHIYKHMIAKVRIATVCGCYEGDSGYCWCDEPTQTTPNANNHTYPDCYLGQIEGPGSMSFDHCAASPGSFVCNNSATCGLDKCYGDGFQHENCRCDKCHVHQWKNSVKVEQHLECGCTPNADCWCNEAPHPTPSPTGHKYPDCYLGQIEGPGSMSFDHCVASPGSFVCNNTDTCGLDKCYSSGFKHENCRCEDCHIHQNYGHTMNKSNIECGCTPNADCWCDEIKL